MAGWSHAKRVKVERNFYAFLNLCFVNSKDHGRICLGESLYDGQRSLITAIFDALENDIHKIYVLKARQLGISTIIRALMIFYVGVHNGLKGALVFDTAPHRDSARNELVTMITDLPQSLKFPPIRGSGRGNRDSMTLVNDSTVLFMSAGVKASKSSGTLGRSEGLTVSHCSELCSYDNPEGMKSFEQSLSEIHPDRLYIYESTARGPNQWQQIWLDARDDDLHCVCLFLGWWSKEAQSIAQDHRDFERYGSAPPSDEEAVKIKAVLDQYNHQITVEQLAWIRYKVDPNSKADGDVEEGYGTDDTVMLAEQAWTEQEAFQLSGAVFFGNKVLTAQHNTHVSHKFKAYWYMAGEEFAKMRVYRAQNTKSIELKVWEEPDPTGVYVLGVDPAYGENENNCRSAIEVLRCYADGVDQVAEYASPLTSTYHLAWVVASLLGWYGYGTAEARYLLELNGPGEAVYNELKSLRFKIENDRTQRQELEERGLADIFKNVRTYIFRRPDSMSPGFNYHFKTTTQLKITIMERLRDFVSSDKLHIRSEALLTELGAIAREGDSISGGSVKDDRAIAMAFAAYYWDTDIRSGMMMQRRTREAEQAKKRLSIIDQVSLYNTHQLDTFFSMKRASRAQRMRQESKNSWRHR